MIRSSHLIGILFVLGLLIPTLVALGMDHPKGEVKGEHWPDGLAEVVNAENRVHGYFVNAQDVFYFQGGTNIFNAQIAQVAVLPETRVVVTIHPGRTDVRSPWDKQPRDIQADWLLLYSPSAWKAGVKEEQAEPEVRHVVEIDLWLGAWIDLDKLDIPKSVEVRSGGEIEAFVESHQKNREGDQKRQGQEIRPWRPNEPEGDNEADGNQC